MGSWTSIMSAELVRLMSIKVGEKSKICLFDGNYYFLHGFMGFVPINFIKVVYYMFFHIEMCLTYSFL